MNKRIKPLLEVETIQSAAARWHKSEDTVRRAIDQGKLDIRRPSPRVTMITVDSLIALWGQPREAVDLDCVLISLPKYWRRRYD